MHPILFSIGKLTIYTYGFFLAVGFLIGIYFARKEARRIGEDPEKMMDLAFYIVIAAIVGSRLFHIITNPQPYLRNPLEIVKIWEGGLVFYGGFIAALLTALFYIKRKGMPIWRTVDIFAPSIALGQFFGRIGCFFAGCCFGKACDLPWAVTFTQKGSLAPLNETLHPSQLYHALANLIIFFILVKFRRHVKRDGQVFWAYVFLYGVFRSLLELFRGDFRGPVFLDLFSVSQCIGITMALIAVGMMIFLNKSAADNADRE
jgi:phosphatidylglycerol:prolipoprotein diacylglycerol transferase